MPADDRRVQRLRAQLERCGRDIAENVDALDVLYAERNSLYADLVECGVKKVTIAGWAGSSSDAVAKALTKLQAS